MKSAISALIIAMYCLTGEQSAAKSLYWTLAGVQRLDLETETVIHIVPDFGPSGGTTGIDYDPISEKLYFGNSEGTIKRVDLDGANLEPIIVNPGYIRDIAIDPVHGEVYWSQESQINKTNLDGSLGVVSVIDTGTGQISGIALDIPRGKVYWSHNESPHRVRSANIADGSGILDLVTNLKESTGLDLDLTSDKMYFANKDCCPLAIRRANLDGTVVEDLIASGIAGPIPLSLDLPSGRMYFTEGPRVRSANLDGTDLTLVWPVGDAVLAGSPMGIIMAPDPNIVVPTLTGLNLAFLALLLTAGGLAIIGFRTPRPA